MRKLCTGGPKHVYLTIIRPGNARFGDSVHLTRQGSPLGLLCTVKERPDGKLDVTACFQKADIIAWLDKVEKK